MDKEKKSYKTAARTHITEYLRQNSDRSVSAHDIMDSLSSNAMDVNISTVYRYLGRLCDEGVVHKYSSDSGEQARFQYTGPSADCDRHLHMQCSRCGRMIHLDCEFMNEITEHILEHHGFEITCRGSVLYGICEKCRSVLRCLVLLVLLTVTAVYTAGCSSAGTSVAAFPDDDHIHVVTTIFAAYDFAVQTGGERADVSLLLKPGCEAHSFEPTPKDIISIESCDVFICAGGENDAWVDTILEAVDNPDLTVIRMTECADTLYEEEEVEGMQEERGHAEHHDHAHDTDGSHGDDAADHDSDIVYGDDTAEYSADSAHTSDESEAEWDEHVWMDMDNAIAICRAISVEFTSRDPEGADYYAQQLESYAAELTAIDDEIRQLVDNATCRELIFADRFPARYFTERYGLTYYAAFPGCSESTEASAATVSFLINKTRDDGIDTIFKMELSSGRLAAIVAEETGATAATFYTGHNISADDYEQGLTFADMMRRNAEVLARALY